MKSLLRKAAGLATVGVMAALLPIVAATPAGAVAANDPISAAVALASGTQVIADNTGANYEASEQGAYEAHHVTSETIYSCWGGASLWYSVPQTVGRIHLHVDSSTFDGALAIWKGSTAHPAASTLTGLDGIEAPSGNTADLEIDLPPAANNFYFVSMDSCNQSNHSKPLSGSDVGTVTFTPTFYNHPVNDNVSGALALADGVAVVADTHGASKETGEQGPYEAHTATTDPIYQCFGGQSIWYRVPTGPRLKITVTGTTFDSAVAVWKTQVNSPAVTDLTGVAGLRPNAVNQSSLDISLAAGFVYFVSIDACHANNSEYPFAVGTVSFTPTLKAPDTTAPTVTVTSPAPAANVAPNTTQTINATVTDADSGVQSVTIGIDGVGSKELPAVGGNAYSAAIPLTNVTPGTYTLRVSAKDNAGNIKDATQIINIVPGGYTGATPGSGVTPVKNPGVKGTGTAAVNVKSLGISKGTKGLNAAHVGSKITIHFVGHKLALHFVSFKHAGIVRIKIDGKASTLNLFRATKAKDIVKLLASAKGGLHTVTITVIGKAPASLGFSAVLWLIGIGK